MERKSFIREEKYKNINDSVKKIIEKYTEKIPVDIEKIVSESGVEFLYKPLAVNVSGKIEKDGDKYKIIVNDFHHPHRQRFTLAHEYAHYLLHKDLIGDGITDDGLYRAEKSMGFFGEIAANRLAAKILMPVELINKLADEVNNIAGIAEKLNVSLLALKIRLGIANR